VDDPTFVDVTLFGRTAEVAGEYLTKGTPVLIEGRLKLDTWEQDGQRRQKLKVLGEKLCLAGGRGDAPAGRQARPKQETQAPSEPADAVPDDIPF
jgi:single-strand DNA-binding protein